MKTQMKNVIFFIMICCSLSLRLLQKDAVKLSNTDFLFKGYNIFLGDLTPKDGDIDPGFEAPIFADSFSQARTTSDRRFEIPDGFFLTRVEGCSLGITSTLITGENSYQNTFGVELGVSGTIKGVKFGASTSYQNVSQETTKNSKAFIYSKADCKVYTGEMDPYDPPKFHKSFLRAITHISNRKRSFTQDPQLYWTFIKNFGTHHIFQVKMGARFGAVSKTSSKEIERMKSNSVSFESSIGFKDIAEVKNKITNENKQTSNSLTKMEEVKMFSIGSRPDANLDPKAWAQQAINEPMPISYNVRPIIDVFSEENILIDMSQFKDIDLPFVRENLRVAFDSYCEKYLLVNKMVRSCQEVGKDLTLNNIKFDQIQNRNFYYLENMETGKCMTSFDRGHSILSVPCGRGNLRDQAYYFDIVDGFYKLTHRAYEKCLDRDNHNNNENGKIITWHCLNNDAQRFRIVENSDGSYTIKTIHDKCLHVRDDNKADNAQIVQSTCNNTPGQRFRAIKVIDVGAMDSNNYLKSIGM